MTSHVRAEQASEEVKLSEEDPGETVQSERSHCQAPGKTRQNEAIQQPLEPSAAVAAVTVTQNSSIPAVIRGSSPSEKNSSNPLPSSTSPAGGVPFPLSLLHQEEFAVTSTKHAITSEENASRQLAAAQRYTTTCVTDPSYVSANDQLSASDPYREGKEAEYRSIRNQTPKLSSCTGFQNQWETDGKGRFGGEALTLNGPEEKQNPCSTDSCLSQCTATASAESKPSYPTKHLEETVIKHRNHYPKDRTYDYLRRTESQKKVLEPKNDLHSFYKCSQKNSCSSECSIAAVATTTATITSIADFCYSRHGFVGRTSYSSAVTVDESSSTLPGRSYAYGGSNIIGSSTSTATTNGNSSSSSNKNESHSAGVLPEKSYKVLAHEQRPEYYEPLQSNKNGSTVTSERLNVSLAETVNHAKYGNCHTLNSIHDKWVDAPYRHHQSPKKDVYHSAGYTPPGNEKKCQESKTLKDNPYGYGKWSYDYTQDAKFRQTSTVGNSSQEQSCKNVPEYAKQDKPYSNWYNSPYFYPKGYVADRSSAKSKSLTRNVQQVVPKQRGPTNDNAEREVKSYVNGPSSNTTGSFQASSVTSTEKSFGAPPIGEKNFYPSVSLSSYHGGYSDSSVPVTKSSPLCPVQPVTSSSAAFYPATVVSYPADVPAHSTIYSSSRDSLKLSWSSASSKSSASFASSNGYIAESVEVPTRGRHSSHSSNSSASSVTPLTQQPFPVSNHPEAGSGAFLSLNLGKEPVQERTGSSNSSSRSRSNSRSATSPAAASGTNCTPTSSTSPSSSSSYETTGSLTSLVFSKPSSWTVPSSSSSSFSGSQLLTTTTSSSGLRSSPTVVSTSLSSSTLTSSSVSSLSGLHHGSIFGLPQAPSQSSFLSGGSQVMFGPSLVPTAPYLQTGAAGPSVFGGESLFVPPNQDLLRRELDTRFLASHDRSINIPPPPYMRTEMHQHQHQHTHMHQHSPFLPPPLGAPLMPQTAAHLYDKFPKLDASFYGRGSIGLPGYPALSPFLAPSAAAAAAAVATPFGPPGHLAAFQPKATSLIKTKPLKSGRWCAMHVRIAWEIYHHQQNQQRSEKGGSAASTPFSTSSKSPTDLLHPTSSLFGSIPKPHDLAFSSSLFGAANRLSSIPPRSPYEVASPHNSFLSPTPAHLGLPPLPRPAYPTFAPPGSAFGGLGTLGLTSAGLFGGKDVGPGVLPGAQDPWSRLHRTPPTFPSPSASSNSSWGGLKAEAERERERLQQKEDQEKERQKKAAAEKDRREKEIDKSKEISRDRREQEKQKDRDRDGRMYHHISNSSHLLHNGEYPDRSREREKVWDPPHEKRERSRSPIRVPSSQRIDSAFENSNSMNKMKHDIRVKEERPQSDLGSSSDMGKGVLNCPPERTKSYEAQKASAMPLNSSDRVTAPSVSITSVVNTTGAPTITAAAAAAGSAVGNGPAPDRYSMPSFWGPMPPAPLLAMNASSLAMSEHYRNYEVNQLRELDREQLVQKYGSLTSGMHMAPDKIREAEISRQSAQGYDATARDAERQSQTDRERQMYDRSKLPPPPLRADMSYVPALGIPSTTSNPSGLFPFSNSFLNSFCSTSLSSTKTVSPTNANSGIPPPLIPCGPAGSPGGTAVVQNHTGQSVHSTPPPPPPQTATSAVPLPQLPASHHKTSSTVSSERESPRESYSSKDKYELPNQGRDVESQSR